MLDSGGHVIFVCKLSSHPIQEYLTGADLPVLEQTVKRGKQRCTAIAGSMMSAARRA